MKREKLLSQDEMNAFQRSEIEQRDERNITLGNAAKARAYELMMCLYAITIVMLTFFDVVSLSAFFILLGVFAICQIYFMIRLWKYHKEI